MNGRMICDMKEVVMVYLEQWPSNLSQLRELYY